MRDSHSAIAKSGTVTLELALHKRPTVVVYELSTLNWFIAKYIVRLKLPFYCIVNILSGTSVFPELIENGFTPEESAYQLKNLHSGVTRDNSIRGCQSIKELFQGSVASQSGALAIRNLFA